MKRINLILLILLFPLVINAQDLPCKEKFKNGRCKERYKEDGQGNIHGTYIEYDANGNRLVLGNYSHGKKHGQWKQAGLNGLGEIIGEITMNYINGELNGIYTSFNTKNNIKETGTFTNGKQTGYWKENGRIEDGVVVYQTGKYINGYREGKWMNVKKITSQDVLVNMLSGNESDTEIGSTAKGFYAIYSNGQVEAYFDDNGNNLTALNEAEQNEEAEALKKEKLEAEERQIKLAEIGKIYNKVNSPHGTITDLELYAELKTKYDPSNTSTYDKTDLNWIKQLNDFLNTSSPHSRLEINFQKFERYVLLNYLKEKTKIDFTSFADERASFTKANIFKTTGVGEDVDHIILGDYWMSGLFLEDGVEEVTVINFYGNTSEPNSYILDVGNKYPINIKENFYSAKNFRELPEREKFYTLLAYGFKIYESNAECVNADFFNHYLSCQAQLTDVHKKIAAIVFSNGILGIENSGRACTSKASGDKKHISITYAAYSLWEAGNKNKAIKCFKYVNEANPTFNRYKSFDDKWEPCSYSDYLTKYFHKWYINNKSGVEDLKIKLTPIQLTDEKELLQTLKNI